MYIFSCKNINYENNVLIVLFQVKMQDVIRNGTLRLMTSEASCDVILSCQGHRLMAHKIILSIASPLLQV